MFAGVVKCILDPFIRRGAENQEQFFFFQSLHENAIIKKNMQRIYVVVH